MQPLGIGRTGVVLIVRGRVSLHRPADGHVRAPGPHRGEVIIGRVVLLGEHHHVIDDLSHSLTLASAWLPAQANAGKYFVRTRRSDQPRPGAADSTGTAFGRPLLPRVVSRPGRPGGTAAIAGCCGRCALRALGAPGALRPPRLGFGGWVMRVAGVAGLVWLLDGGLRRWRVERVRQTRTCRSSWRHSPLAASSLLPVIR